MKKHIVLLLALAMLLSLSACKTPTEQNDADPIATTAAEAYAADGEAAESAPVTVASAAPTEITAVPTEPSAADPTATEVTEVTAAPAETATEMATGVPDEPTQAPTEAPTEIPTEDTAPHSAFYVPGVSQDEMVAYFSEVVLGMEYTDGEGDAAVVQKWERPVSYRIEGVPDHRDAQIINELSKQLNQVEGFPGIGAAKGLEQNVTISFLHDEEFNTQFAHLLKGEAADGAAQFWYYNNTNDIYSGRIGYRKDADQQIRESVIPEEIVNLLGIGDTVLREDSITYQNGSEATELSAVDWAIIKLLYNPRIHCGMNAAECETIIRELYY